MAAPGTSPHRAGPLRRASSPHSDSAHHPLNPPVRVGGRRTCAVHVRRTNSAQRDVGPDGHTTSTPPAEAGPVSSTAIPATIASNARSDGGASALTTAFDNACSTFDRFIPTDTTGRPAAGTDSRTPLRSVLRDKERAFLSASGFERECGRPCAAGQPLAARGSGQGSEHFSPNTLAVLAEENCPAQELTGVHPSTAVSPRARRRRKERGTATPTAIPARSARGAQQGCVVPIE